MTVIAFKSDWLEEDPSSTSPSSKRDPWSTPSSACRFCLLVPTQPDERLPAPKVSFEILWVQSHSFVGIQGRLSVPSFPLVAQRAVRPRPPISCIVCDGLGVKRDGTVVLPQGHGIVTPAPSPSQPRQRSAPPRGNCIGNSLGGTGCSLGGSTTLTNLGILP